MKSMYEALISDDPNKLESPFGMILNKDKSELKKFWNKGIGKLTYDYVVEMSELETGKGVMVSGSPELFKPNIDRKFADEISKEQVYFLDQSSGEDTKLFIGKSWGVKQFSVEDLFEKCKKVFTETKPYRLTVSLGNYTSIIPLKEWLKTTYTNYLDLIEKFKKDKIEKYEFEYAVFENLPIVAKCQFNHRDYDAEKISRHTKVKLDVVKAILRKSISTLQNTESSDKLDEIRDKINKYKKLDGKVFVKEVINGI